MALDKEKGQDKEITKEAERLQKAAAVVNEIMGTPDKAIPQDLLDKAVCVGVIPSELKFALGVGGSFGRGALVCRGGRQFRTATGWSSHRRRVHRDERQGCSEVGAKQCQTGRGRLGSCGTGGP